MKLTIDLDDYYTPTKGVKYCKTIIERTSVKDSKKKEVPTNQFQHWTENENTELLALASTGIPVDQIAKKLQRTISAVTNRLGVLARKK